MPAPAAARTGRARPLKPDDRRAALVAATLPLLMEHGPGVSTRAIAEAAGVAEGTLFRVFPSKEALVQAAVTSALDEGPLLTELAAVDRTRSLRRRVVAGQGPDERTRQLRSRLVTVTELLQRRHAHVVRLMMAVGPQLRPPPGECPPHQEQQQRRGEAITAAVAALVEPDAALLRVPPRELARLLRQLTFAGAHPGFGDADPMTAAEIVAVLLDGVLSRPSDVREDAPC